jgi:predicted RNA-binding Zn-ribbon protein involved in translation (DUF1610 family)
MSDFVSLTCPNCGRVLPVADSAHISEIASTIYTCDSCGVKSILKRDSGKSWLETYAACPKCNNNDKSIKISALVKSVNKPNIDLRFPEKPHDSDFVPQKFVPQEFPCQFYSSSNSGFKNSGSRIDYIDLLRFGVFAALGVLFFLVFIAIYLGTLEKWTEVFRNSSSSVIAWSVLAGVFFLMSHIPYLVYILSSRWTVISEKLAYQAEQPKMQAFYQSEDKRKKLFEQAEMERQKNFKKSEKERKDAFIVAEARRMKAETARYERAVDRWKKIYYCGRDDIAFIFGTNEYTDSEKFQEFLYR